ncbi:MAG: 6-phosphofructokinase, partial [candidate division KSB1 bacterium]|nr:6-phosphofructokinase [candidate division KSB1 bacterium]
VSRIHFEGGSILRTSRANPTKTPDRLRQTVESLHQLGLDYLITIGGDDTAYAASVLASHPENRVKIAHVPKTIDNDLPLPGNIPTFGYQTARHLGAQLVRNLMEDSRTTNRWYIVVSMGRKAGHLALGIGKAAGATLTIIAEEFDNRQITIKEVCDVIEGSIIKRKARGRDDGLCVVAEGIAEHFSKEELAKIPGMILEYDDFGNIRLAEVELGKILKLELERRFKERGDKLQIVEINIGYELRSAPPIPFDQEYTRDLGYSAVRYLLSLPPEDKGGALICVDAGKLVPMRFQDIIDPATGKTRVRMVDVKTESYQVARNYMIRLEREDFEDPEELARLAAVAKMTPEQFKQRFGYLVGITA